MVRQIVTLFRGPPRAFVDRFPPPTPAATDPIRPHDSEFNASGPTSRPSRRPSSSWSCWWCPSLADRPINCLGCSRPVEVMTRGFRPNQLLAVTNTMCACATFCFLFVAVTTNYWLYTMELTLDSNGTTFYVKIYSGLWKKCLDDRRRLPATYCENINYFDHVDRDGLRPTDSILLSLRRATAFPMVTLCLLLVAQTLCLMTHCSQQRQLLTVITGVLYVLGGLSLLAGLIIYIGAITEEGGNRPKSMDEPKFIYQYGPSLFLTIASFVGAELTGVLSVHLFISRRRDIYTKRLERAVALSNNSDGGTTTPLTRPKAAASRPRVLTTGAPPRHGIAAIAADMSANNSPSRCSDTYGGFTDAETASKDLSTYSMLSYSRDASRSAFQTPLISPQQDFNQRSTTAAGGWYERCIGGNSFESAASTNDRRITPV